MTNDIRVVLREMIRGSTNARRGEGEDQREGEREARAGDDDDDDDDDDDWFTFGVDAGETGGNKMNDDANDAFERTRAITSGSMEASGERAKAAAARRGAGNARPSARARERAMENIQRARARARGEDGQMETRAASHGGASVEKAKETEKTLLRKLFKVAALADPAVVALHCNNTSNVC